MLIKEFIMCDLISGDLHGPELPNLCTEHSDMVILYFSGHYPVSLPIVHVLWEFDSVTQTIHFNCHRHGSSQISPAFFQTEFLGIHFSFLYLKAEVVYLKQKKK